MKSVSTLSYELEVKCESEAKDKVEEKAMLVKGLIYAGHVFISLDPHSSHEKELTDGETRP